MRPSWDEYFMEIVELIKTRSTCLRRQVGALIVKDKRILATGYNGAPMGCKHCSEIGCLRRNSMCLPDRGMSFAGQFTRSKMPLSRLHTPAQA